MAKTRAKHGDKDRNPDGTFTVGNQAAVGNHGGRPRLPWSFRAQAKIRATNDPNVVSKTLDALIQIAHDPKNPQCVKGCPVEVRIPNFIKLITEGKFDEAAEFILLSLKRQFDVEVAEHLIEVLVAAKRNDEAASLWQDLRKRTNDAPEVLAFGERMGLKR